jgi:polar amino acid transport system substrate-binding protein
MRGWRRTVVLACGWALGAVCGWAQAQTQTQTQTQTQPTSPLVPAWPEPITITWHEYPPLMSEDLAGRGLLSQIVTEAFALGGVKVKLVPVSTNRAIEAARAGLYTGSMGWARNPDRERDLLFTEPVMLLRMVFCQLRARQFSWQSLEDLSARRLGITAGNYYSEGFTRLQAAGRLTVDVAGSDVANLRKLLLGRIDMLPIGADTAQYLMDVHLTADEQAQITCGGQAYWNAPIHAVISRKVPQAEDLVQRFNRGLDQLRATGAITRMATDAHLHYFAPDIEP